jgi:hypothetical protein
MAEARGLPAMTSASTLSSPWSRLKVSTSSPTHRDRAEAGEHSTTRNRDEVRAAVSAAPRLPDAGSSSRSRKIGVRRRGTGPIGVAAPTSFLGIR